MTHAWLEADRISISIRVKSCCITSYPLRRYVAIFFFFCSNGTPRWLVYRESTSFQDRLRRFFRFPVDSEHRENGEPFPLPPAMDIAIRKRLTIRERIIDPRYENSPLSLSHPEKHDRVGIELRANSKRFFERILLTRSLNRFERKRERERESKILDEGKLAAKLENRLNRNREGRVEGESLLFLTANF